MLERYGHEVTSVHSDFSVGNCAYKPHAGFAGVFGGEGLNCCALDEIAIMLTADDRINRLVRRIVVQSYS